MPESSISQTFVTGGRAAWGFTAGVGAGVDGFDACGADEELGDVAELDAGVAEAAAPGPGVVAGGGVAWALAGGGFTALECPPDPASAVSAGSSSGTREAPASELSGAGPMAAPTATPTASITPARTAVARPDGRRTGPCGAGASGDAGTGAGSVGEVGVSGISVIS